ncbi:hypothetical protein J3458_007253 [Metarhizium acridum]|uniref:uncharacterized protein n=1 Tax=Metarhizium acridum TaxID=92637 RepID=UPI001C6C1CE4|nr:hypothetical protein J3458_007253 [Metarhizium acridum]
MKVERPMCLWRQPATGKSGGFQKTVLHTPWPDSKSVNTWLLLRCTSLVGGSSDVTLYQDEHPNQNTALTKSRASHDEYSPRALVIQVVLQEGGPGPTAASLVSKRSTDAEMDFAL